jgi:hypothetical protein
MRRGRLGMHFAVTLAAFSALLTGATLGARTASAHATTSAANRHFVGTITLEEHRVWDYSSSFVDEHGSRTLIGTAKVDLEVDAVGSVIKSKVTGASFHGSTHLVEEIHPGSCNISDKDSLGAGAVTVAGSVGNLATSWPWSDDQVDVGTCTGEPSGHVVRLFAWTPSCTSSDTGKDGAISYNSHFQPPFGTGGVGSLTTYTCKGTLRLASKTKYLDQFVGSGGRLTDLTAGKNGTKVEFILHDWDPAGGPITLSWGGMKVQSFTPPDPSAESFSTSGTFSVDEWLTRGTLTNPGPCKGTLVARQGSVSRTLDLASGAPVAAVVYAEKTHGTLGTGDLVCYGEYQGYTVDTGGAIVFATAPDNGYTFDVAISQPQPAALDLNDPTAYLIIEDGERDSLAYARIDPAALACVQLSGNRWFRITGGPGQLGQSTITTGTCPARQGSNSPVMPKAIATAPSDEVQIIEQTNHPPSLEGLNEFRGPGKATFSALTCTDALFWSPGDVFVSNGISGRCNIISGGRIELHGPIDDGGVLEAKELLLYGR